jgi:hypothetical protein
MKCPECGGIKVSFDAHAGAAGCPDCGASDYGGVYVPWIYPDGSVFPDSGPPLRLRMEPDGAIENNKPWKVEIRNIDEI